VRREFIDFFLSPVVSEAQIARVAQLSLEPADKSKYFKATAGSIAARRIEEQP